MLRDLLSIPWMLSCFHDRYLCLGGQRSGQQWFQELRRSQLEIQVGNISVEVRTENLELEDPGLGWDYELKEEAARPKEMRRWCRATQRRASAEWKGRGMGPEGGQERAERTLVQPGEGGMSSQWNSWDGEQSEWVQG